MVTKHEMSRYFININSWKAFPNQINSWHFRTIVPSECHQWCWIEQLQLQRKSERSKNTLTSTGAICCPGRHGDHRSFLPGDYGIPVGIRAIASSWCRLTTTPIPPDPEAFSGGAEGKCGLCTGQCKKPGVSGLLWDLLTVLFPCFIF